MADRTFVSYAQNGEDVVLWRALKGISAGRYIDVGANHPRIDSISRAFYDRGWRGITVEPIPELAHLHRLERPEDHLAEAVISSRPVESLILHAIDGTGLSTTVDSVGERHRGAGFEIHDLEIRAQSLNSLLDEAGWAGVDIHFMTIDVEGAESDVLNSVDLNRWRPWVLVIESTMPNSSEQTHHQWESVVLSAGYEFCLFDGLSRFYVASEHPELKADLSYPTCALDQFTPRESERLREEIHDRETAIQGLSAEVQRLAGELSQMTDDAVRWRAAALTRWASAVSASEPELNHLHHTIHLLQNEIDAIHGTVSWRVTTPLRAVRSRGAKLPDRHG